MVVPLGFREDVERAAAEENSGDLELLGQEAAGFPWEVEGWRLVGRCQFKLKIYEGAKESWEAVRNHDPRDREANKLLATIYQRLKDYPRSSQAIQRVLDLDDLSLDDRAEAFALIGSNSKEEWRRELQEGDLGGLPARALQSAFLERSYQNYRTGFELNLNHFYSGLNALAMLTVQIELARALPEVWAEQFETPKEVEELERERARLAVAVEVSLESCEKDEQRRNKEEPWLSISKADLKFLTIPTAKGVAAAYRQALAGTQPFHRDAVRRQLLLYRQLGIRKEHVQAAMAVMGEPEPADPSLPKRVILFTGHRIDAPSRTKPRFPPEKEQAARSEIRKKVIEEKDLAKGEVIGIAGAASGGDILFHEVCEELNLKSAVFLALPQNDYCASSVQDAGPGWVDRFNRLCERSKPHVLGPEQELPRWLQGKKDYNIWQRSNLWMLSHSLTRDARNLTLIALWDGQAGDAPGGTSDMVERAKGRGAKFVHLDTRAIF
jgi:tetratricopeptide (TPR) repeat protein